MKTRSRKLCFSALMAVFLFLGISVVSAQQQQPPPSDSSANSNSAKSNSAAQTPAKPAPKPAAQPQTPPANGAGIVWVNTESRVYHKPGSRYYGKTKKGKYMTEADARKAGYRPAVKND